MANNRKLLSVFEAELNIKERQLLKERQDIRNFVETLHTTKETAKAQTHVNRLEQEISTILQSLLDTQDISTSFRVEANNLCQRCRELNNYTRDMHKALADDLVLRQLAEEKKVVDLIKQATFFFAIPGVFITAVKNGVGHGTISVDEATGAGLIVSTVVISNKKIKSAFQAASKAICDIPRQIKNSFLLFYVKETIKENKIATQEAFRNGAIVLKTGMSMIAMRRKDVVGRSFTQKNQL